jgi:hypothetical protein
MPVLLFAATLCAAQNAELRALAEEDQAVRTSTATTITRTDDDRIKRVLEIIAKGGLGAPEDQFNAALILDHTPLDLIQGRLVSKSPYNYLLAHDLAVESFAAGYQRSRTLVAQTIDRYLAFTEGYQKYGTNRIINQETGREELVWIDRSVPDSERAKYGVPPLADLLKRWPERPKPANLVR